VPRESRQVVNCGIRKLVELNPEYAVQVSDDADVEVRSALRRANPVADFGQSRRRCGAVPGVDDGCLP
jgi:hypothetical protein